ncbi:hypothetical protein TBS_01670 [Thermobispora bispora]|jgi:hypothetical protein|uniref:Uncharacterized protein n=1 Tax=Thermobispora bispora (strain ATCC 19993 / DSM 43833 / CBS 139.67 / JCM 10125 / KCTC 9307 / NBRC 14880 / R51) TaxID=469371 RepID=D6Y8L4_THEBD|nr:hypothetical protein [Thermobispora bispora]ADG87911.1 hypothetical protein Tbis_1189 [Thermobispora bispora DSM 43833]MBO2473795.1 hypothetical protein [Actinomycetales bacterium]MBX6169319.1 hypothetical protein [Thermobispora bispora]QSI47790.1 hypothetical protein CYL17_07870 [Thermobispora bispora]
MARSVLSLLGGRIGFRRLPGEVRAALALERGERVLTHARTSDGGHCVATTQALHLPGGVRLPWHLVDRATWTEEALTVTMTDGRVHRVPVAEPGLLPETIRERVTATIVVSQYVSLGDRGGVRLIARRVPGYDLPRWEFLFDPGLDPADPGLRALAEQALEDVRRSLGV